MAISILIVDNDELTRHLLVRLLGFTLPQVVLYATDIYEDAAELCTKLAIDIVITSTTMPPNTCHSMLHYLRVIRKEPVKVIVMTSSGERQIVCEDMYNMPDTYLIPKPIDKDRLVAMIKDRITDIKIRRSAEPATDRIP